MGHAGANISGRTGRASDKLEAMRAAGIQVVEDLGVLGETVKARLG
jgi:succinyl-CoA synthetase alpha subunit